MHGILFKELQRYVSKKFGLVTWCELLKSSDLDKKLYLPTQIYPDEEINALLSSVSVSCGRPLTAVLEDFGEFLLPNLLQVYGNMVQPHWRTLDLLERTENTVHRAVRYIDDRAAPPRLVCTRVSADQVVIDYSSRRNMSRLGVGIIRGISRHFEEDITIQEMYSTNAEGLSHCQLTVTLTPPTAKVV
jgi:hypothetical protein